MKFMKIGIVGSREYRSPERIRELVETFGAGTVVVSGGARGADSAAAEAARSLGFEVIEHLPKHEKSAPYFKVVQALFARNTLIAQDADELHAFINWGHRSNGTFDTITKANRLEKLVVIHFDALGGDNIYLPRTRFSKTQLEKLVYRWEA